MPVRKIGISDRSITGRHGPSGQQFESALERDLLDLLAFDLNVERFETQPLRVPYVDNDGRVRTYTPDVLVYYRRDIVPARQMPHTLIEVKYRDEYSGKFRELKTRFRAARLYARERGWRFRVMTECHIRTPLLDNARFLQVYRKSPSPPGLEFALREQMRRMGAIDAQTLIVSMADSQWMRGTYIRVLWRLVANGRIWTDLTVPLTMGSMLWYVE